jgi:hypothetical protein
LECEILITCRIGVASGAVSNVVMG